jgi:hypothetical protein
MLRKLLLGGFSSLCFLGYASLATAAEPPREKTAAAHDLRPIMEKLRKNQKLVNGKNKVHAVAKEGEVPGYTLYAVVAKGRIKGWEAVTAEGKKLPLEQKGGPVTCWVCVTRTLKDGSTSESCWQVSCDDLPVPVKTARMINSSCGCASRT